MVSLRSISARSLWSHAGMLARLFATLALAPPVGQSTANSIENAYDNKCLRHLVFDRFYIFFLQYVKRL